eukprot:3659259-Amphidinium_carterae.1
MLSARPAPTPPAASLKAKAKSSPKAGTEKEMLSQLLSAVSSLGDRMTVLESAQRPPPKASAHPTSQSVSGRGVAPIAAQPGFLPAPSAGSPVRGSSMIGAPPTQSPYEQSLEEARRLLALPNVPHTQFREDAGPGAAVPKER